MQVDNSLNECEATSKRTRYTVNDVAVENPMIKIETGDETNILSISWAMKFLPVFGDVVVGDH